MMAWFSSFPARVCSTSNRANCGVESLLFVIGLGMALLTGTQVFSRYLLNHSLFWSEEVGRMCLVWISFLGASAVYKRGGHIGIHFLVQRLPHRARRILAILLLLLSFIFFAVMILFGFSFVAFTAGQKTAALGIPKSIPYLAIPISGLMFFLHGLSHLLQLLASREPGR
jgi:TRAP-type C4-dicarboxylate transport system permease small subunit